MYYLIVSAMARPSKSMTDPLLLTAALEGLQMQKKRIEDQISQVKKMLGTKSSAPAAVAAAPAAVATRKAKRKGTMSPEGRARIALAQKKRWAAQRKKAAAE